MKLIDLLSYIPDECEIGLLRPGDKKVKAEGLKREAIAEFADKNKLIEAQVENFDVYNVYSCARVQCAEELLFESGTPSLHVMPAVIIEIGVSRKECTVNG